MRTRIALSILVAAILALISCGAQENAHRGIGTSPSGPQLDDDPLVEETDAGPDASQSLI